MNLNNVLARAQQMMLDENFQRDVERAARAAGGGSRRGGSPDDFSAEEEALFGVSSSPSYAKNQLPENVNYKPVDMSGVKILRETAEPRDLSTSKLPKAILESFAKTPSPVDAFDVNAIEAQLQFVDEPKPQAKQQVREQARPQPVQQYAAPQNGGVDYNYLKYIINECIKENLKGTLNESVNGTDFRGMRIAPGNVIQFIDSKGNLYEGQLKLKKKATK